jgi:hypothetical protein
VGDRQLDFSGFQRTWVTRLTGLDLHRNQRVFLSGTKVLFQVGKRVPSGACGGRQAPSANGRVMRGASAFVFTWGTMMPSAPTSSAVSQCT